jgi:hypothetical protein
MRVDMYKVIVERPRHWKGREAAAVRLRDDPDGPLHLGMRAGYDYRVLNENLAPLRRYLHAQVGRPWDKVFGEICAGIDRRNTVQQHIHQHIDDFVAVDVAEVDGELVNLRNQAPWSGSLRQDLYVDARTGLLRRVRRRRSWRQLDAERREREQAELAACRRLVDERTVLLLIEDAWFRVEVSALPGQQVTHSDVGGRLKRRVTAESRYDVVLRRNVSSSSSVDLEHCERNYGSSNVYAVGKRQLSKREIRAYGLR